MRSNHAQNRKDDEDNLKEAEERASEIKTAKVQSDLNDKVAEHKRKLNPFDGLVHDDDGKRYTDYFPNGNGPEVAGVNDYMKMKNKSKKGKHTARKHRDDREFQID